jgi:ABC-type transport system involved in multi-copper enzyme maturation permease subunit
MLVPLASLLIGTSSAVSEDATGFLLAQPVSRTETMIGRWLGQSAAVAISLAVGFGTGGALVVTLSGATDVARLAILIVACLLAGLAFLSVATLIVSAVSRRSTAMGIAAFVWFFAVILYDAAMLAIAVSASGTAGARILFVSVFGNVVDLVRVLALLLAGTPHVLGAAGDSWLRALGGANAGMMLSVAVLVAWIFLPLVVAARIQATRDV